ncbi:hypothetical protein Glove_232g217 [Diversispora epigaea]|uniref:Uncharacterized protein n=1 Tax=Diversispora epigaea TaxID=1348612 RepID=A0A397IKJ0_9GLOM|nr:hypothetical protein Glove_232g217 [Diversispora epigaea]
MKQLWDANPDSRPNACKLNKKSNKNEVHRKDIHFSCYLIVIVFAAQAPSNIPTTTGGPLNAN